MKYIRRTGAATWLLSLLICISCAKNNGSDDPVRTVYHNANIYTSDSRMPRAEAMVVGDGKILFVGDAEDAKKQAGANSKWVDLENKTILPGFVESHLHPEIASLSELNIRKLDENWDLDRILGYTDKTDPHSPG